MSAFGFTDEPVQDSADNGESAFSFTDGPVEENNESSFNFGSNDEGSSSFNFGMEHPESESASEFSFGSSAEPTPSAPQPKAAPKPAYKKKTPRVLGQGKKKKPSRFAKKPGDSNLNLSSTQKAQLFPSKPKTENAESTTPEPAAPKLAPSQPTPEIPQESEQTSSFSFTSNENETAPPQYQPEEEVNPFSAPSANSFSSQNVQQETSQAPIGSSSEAVAVSDEIEGLDTEGNSFVQRLKNCLKDIKTSVESTKKDKVTLSDLERRQINALNSEQYELADQLNTSIIRTKNLINEQQNTFIRSLSNAFSISNDAPGHLLSHAAASQNELPQLRVRKSALDKRLTTLVEEQENDKQTIDTERKRNEETIKELERPLNEHRASHEALEQELQQRIDAAKQPFVDQLNQYQAETEEHSKIIQDLQAQINQHKKSISELKSKIQDTKKQIRNTENQFNNEKIEVQNDQYNIKIETEKFNQKVKEIEAPYQSLLDAVDKRDIEITGITAAIDKIAKQIDDGEKDASECESAAKIINTLCHDHFSYSEKRDSFKQKYDTALKNQKENEAQRNKINEDVVELRSKLQTASDQLMAAKASIPTLETSKKAAVAAKNFRGAQQLNKQIASMNEQIVANESLVAQTTELIEKMEAQAMQYSSEISKAQVDLEESKVLYLQLDFEFFSNSIEEMKSLFKISPFGEKLLSPLLEMLQIAKDNTEVPKVMSKEEMEEEIQKLNQKLEEAIAQDDFDSAAQIQDQIDTLTAKVEKLTQK
ncbi:UvrB/uvrC motif family protein [Histomonas meleagridis]|uniref:UvrB/uvrC motif family protein n=1 Tax=Histomonas meleagridis TaxID=135588 RepID=UPI00355ACAAE|nr:UvrB/uvrC motif family protein [Histomonas meleagridis]KAH0799527.1 UvrB/uvrC motif family protein [Histomonas meleagridis]